MAIDALVKPLLRLPLFQGLKPLQLTEIVRRAGRMVYKPGDVLIREDDTGDCSIIIVSGEAFRVPDGDQEPAEVVPEGSMVAELAMLIETMHSATIIARTPIRALKISRDDLHEQMGDDPALAEHLMSRIADRLTYLVREIHAIDESLARLTEPQTIPNLTSWPASGTPSLGAPVH